MNAGIAKLSVGRPEDDAVIVPVVSKSSADFIEGLVKDAEAKGATLCQPYKREGNLIWPLLIDKARLRCAARPAGCVPPLCTSCWLVREWYGSVARQQQFFFGAPGSLCQPHFACCSN